MIIKILPIVLGQSIDIDTISAKSITYTKKALTPWSLNKIKASRLGSDVTITVYPSGFANGGAGTANENTNAPNPMVVETNVSFEHYTSYDSTKLYSTNPIILISNASAFYFYAAVKEGAYLSAVKSVSIGSTDGDYYGY